jgi:Rrf2 family protein
LSEAANLAVHAMGYLASNAAAGPVSAAQIAEALSFSRDHLNKVLQRLNRVGLVASRRGPRGGFVLGRPAKSVTLLEIVEAIDGSLAMGECMLGSSLCGTRCALGALTRLVFEQVHKVLAETRLSSLPNLPA